MGSTVPGRLDVARRTARSVKGPMWLVAKKGIRRMPSLRRWQQLAFVCGLWVEAVRAARLQDALYL